MAEIEYIETSERKSLRERVSERVWRICYRTKRSIARLIQRINYRFTKRMHKVVIYRTVIDTY